MALLYLDTSALAKLYVSELGSERMLELASAAEGHRFSVCAIAQVELHSAVRRRQRAGDMTDDAANQILARFEYHLNSRFLRQEVNEQVIELASELISRNVLRAYDAIQLAACLTLKSESHETPIFVCADRNLMRAAQSEGLATLNPESNQPIPDS